jgi:hypothetical protein
MKMIDEKFETSRGEHHLYTVRSMGPGRGFGIVDRLRNWVIAYPFWTREDAWGYLRETDA